jgi:hypothetical protein
LGQLVRSGIAPGELPVEPKTRVDLLALASEALTQWFGPLPRSRPTFSFAHIAIRVWRHFWARRWSSHGGQMKV